VCHCLSGHALGTIAGQQNQTYPVATLTRTAGPATARGTEAGAAARAPALNAAQVPTAIVLNISLGEPLPVTFGDYRVAHLHRGGNFRK
jgi:hypothetical protein